MGNAAAIAAAFGGGLPPGVSGTNERCTVLVSNFDPDRIDEDKLFNLFSIYGNIVRIKILRNKPDHALVQMGDGFQAELAVNFLKACYVVLQSWVSKKFMTGCVVLFPVAVTFFITWWFIQFVDGFFSPIYARLGINIFGLGFITSLIFVFFVGIFVSSWMGATVIWIGEWFIKRMPFVKHIYSASKQISSAISPDQNTMAFKEVAIIRHPRIGEYAFGFITSSVVLQRDNGDEELCSVYVPTNHLYIGDIFLVGSEEIIRPNLSIREGIEIIVSGGMTMPQLISPQERIPRQNNRIPLNRIV